MKGTEYLEARVRRLELKHDDTAAQTLAEVRELRAWIDDHLEAIGQELARITRHLMANGGDDVDV